MAGNGTGLDDLPGNINNAGLNPADISAEILATSLEIERDAPDAWQPVGVPVRRVVARAPCQGAAKARRAMIACNRLYGGSVKNCGCRLPGGGWAECPPAARGVLVPAPRARPTPSLSGDICATCGSPHMVRTGTCLTCQNCGDTSGGCS